MKIGTKKRICVDLIICGSPLDSFCLLSIGSIR